MKEKKKINIAHRKKVIRIRFSIFSKNKGQMTHLHSLALLVHSGGSLAFFLKNEIERTDYFLSSAQQKDIV